MKILQLICYFTSVICLPEQRIGEGVELLDPKKFPFYAMFIRRYCVKNLMHKNICGGSLIHPGWILTAGHCLPNDTSEFNQILHMDVDMIFMGSVYRPPNNRFGQARKIIEIHRHPGYINTLNKNGNGRNLKNDIALIKLNKPFTLSNTINVIELSTSFRKYDYGTAIGIGRIRLEDSAKLSKIVKYAKMSIDHNYKPKSSKTVFVAYSKISKDHSVTDSGYALPGDSGGPFIYDNDKRSILIGIMSMFSINRKGKNVTNFFERVDYYHNFIKKYVRFQDHTSYERSKIKVVSNATNSVFVILYLFIFILCICIV